MNVAFVPEHRLQRFLPGLLSYYVLISKSLLLYLFWVLTPNFNPLAFSNVRSASTNYEQNMAEINVTKNLNNATLNETLKNATLTGRAAATPQGLFVAYTSLVVMALLPIWYGSFKSVLFNKKQKVKKVAIAVLLLCLSKDKFFTLFCI